MFKDDTTRADLLFQIRLLKDKVRKQLIKLHVMTEVAEYVADEYRDQETGQRVHTDFPPGIVDDVTYDGTVKAMAYLINNELYTSIDKTRKLLNCALFNGVKP